MILYRVSFVVMVSVFLRRSQLVIGAPALEKSADEELLKPDTNVQDEVNFIGSIGSILDESNESKTKEAGTEASGDNPFANFNPNNTIAYSSSNILPNDTPYDMIFIPSSEVPSDIDILESDLSSADFSENDNALDETIDGNIGADKLAPVNTASESDYGDYYSYIGDWRELSWLTEFSEKSPDENFENTLLGADDTDNRLMEISGSDESKEDDDDEQTNEIGGYEEAIDGVKTRKKRSLEDSEEEEEDEDVLKENESSLASSYYDLSVMSSESDMYSSVSEDVSEVDEAFNEVDPKRADIEKTLARYPRPGGGNNWDNDGNDLPFYEGEKRGKRAIDLFKYYTLNFPTLEGMRKRGNGDFLMPFDFDNIANDLVPAETKSKRSLQPARFDNGAWNTLDASFDTSSYELGPFDSDEEQSEDLNNDVYMPEDIGNSREFGHFLPHVVSVSPEFESRRGHRFDIPDYNEGKYLAYRSANLNPLANGIPIANSPDVPDPADLLKLYRIVQNLNPQDVIDARKPRMYLPGPHAGYQAYGNEIHRGMFGSKRSSLQKALLNPLPIGLKQVYRPRQTNTHRNVLNTIGEYLDSEDSDIDTSNSIENEMEGGVDVATTLEELMKEIDELTIIEKLLRLVQISNEGDEQIRR